MEKLEVMRMEEKMYYSFQDILKFLGIDYEFERKEKKEYPFNREKENVTFSWGEVLIPKYGIMKMVQNKISGINEKPISEINMIYSIPFVEERNNEHHVGSICKNISLSFKYDKEYKYGDITKSIYECCFWIIEHARRTNDFYIIKDDMVQEFFSYCVINNQWGLGSMVVCSSPNEKFGQPLGC